MRHTGQTLTHPGQVGPGQPRAGTYLRAAKEWDEAADRAARNEGGAYFPAMEAMYRRTADDCRAEAEKIGQEK